jgi:uncharacterized protein (TIGR02145 family)
MRKITAKAIALLITLTLTACNEKEAAKPTTEPPAAATPAAKPPEPASGNIKSVKIGSQVWMAENLNIETGNSKCYDNDPANCKKYGRLYNWETAMKACPTGWKLPSPNDWSKLLSYVDGTSGTDPYESKTVGKYLKAKSWDKNDGTDKFGFSALPGGNGDESGGFALIGSNGFWWGNTSDEFYLFMTDIDDIVRASNINGEDEGDFRLLLSVRCIKD